METLSSAATAVHGETTEVQKMRKFENSKIQPGRKKGKTEKPGIQINSTAVKDERLHPSAPTLPLATRYSSSSITRSFPASAACTSTTLAFAFSCS